MEKKIKLSFCMIVKNEEENLKRCLDSLQQILQKQYVELVILDTGSTDKTVEIAKSYTDKVYFAEWNNNFSDMRNKAISYTNGEWLFSLDADETLETPNELISLIESGSLNGKMSVMVKIKSFFYKNNIDKFLLESNFKIFRNDKDFCYRGAIHNQPNVRKPIMASEILLNHYGYLIKDKNLMEKKFNRTSSILKEEIEKDPKNIYYSFQLSVSYSMYGKHDLALKQIRKTFELLNNIDYKLRKKYAFIYSVYSKNAFACGQYKEVINIAEEGVRLRPDYLDLYNILGYTYQKLGNIEKMKSNFQKYLDLYSKKERLDVYNDASIALYSIDQSSLNKANILLANYYYENNEFENSLEHINNASEQTDQKMILLTKIHMKKDEPEKIIKYLNENESYYNKVTIIIEEMKKLLEPEKQDKMDLVFAKGEGIYSEYCLLNRGFNEELKLYTFLKKIDFKYVPFFYGEVVKDLNISKRFVDLFRKNEQVTIINLFRQLLKNDYKYENKLIKEILSIDIKENDFRSIKTLLVIHRAILENSNNYSEEVHSKYFEIFNKYLYYGELFIKYLYGEEKLRILSTIINDNEHRFFINFYFVKKMRGSNNTMLQVKLLKEAKENLPTLNNYIKEYARLHLSQNLS
ncbi:glycosyltransferase [Alkalicella caledoniensis]|uniref:Glycosyltransferase n=1 Tax=Alkalicella caledoniensis TaxID=2731377 RepID=A0A7G9W701_ALKCA|nr:glycosyltransferase family 2 protein [Alkalicella caledoniensis]QNO14463.1 glycosyltransferase [Alkalicella caledoniensis]